MTIDDSAGAGTPGLRRTLGLWQVTFSGVGVILGAGVYALIGPAAGLAGGGLWVAFLLAGSIAGLTAYAYARLGSIQPKDAPEFQYTSLAFGPRVGFLAGWLMLAADLLAAATVALGFGGYVQHLIGTPVTANALALVGLATVAMYEGVGKSVGIAMILTVIEAAGLGVVILVGIPSWTTAGALDLPHGSAGLWAAVSLIFFAYLGFDELGNFAEEMRNPRRDLPRALCLALTIATAIYLAVAFSATSVVGWQELAGSEAPLALVVGTALGGHADTLLSLMALAATANTVLLLLVSGSRSVYGMAAAGVLPSALGRINQRGIPLAGSAVVVLITAAALFLGNLQHVAELTNAALLVSFSLTNLSLGWLAYRSRTALTVTRRVADGTVAAIAVVLCGWLLLYTGWESVAVTALLAGAGFLVNLVSGSKPREANEEPYETDERNRDDGR
ncbi:MAG: APC family permease [Chloroflexi bacterium]|nr:APC family permease [Chloroflexota bacterium]